MTGPEHYREAERLLARRPDFDGRPDASPPWESDVRIAQVHATLALAAATAVSGPGSGTWPQWREVVGIPAGTP